MDVESRRLINSGVSKNKAVLSFQDLLQVSRLDAGSDYFSLSVDRQGQSVRIQISTTDAHPITYTAIIPGQGCIDFNSLLFVAQ
jgi:hypothetical protein